MLSYFAKKKRKITSNCRNRTIFFPEENFSVKKKWKFTEKNSKYQEAILQCRYFQFGTKSHHLFFGELALHLDTVERGSSLSVKYFRKSFKPIHTGRSPVLNLGVRWKDLKILPTVNWFQSLCLHPPLVVNSRPSATAYCAAVVRC